MITLLFFESVICMFIGHIFKVKRWALFISVYEEPSESNLLRAMILGHTLNAILPVRIGDAVRVFCAGKRIKNGYLFSLATVIVDIYIDILTVGLMFFSLLLIGKGDDRLLETTYFYRRIIFFIVPVTFFCVLFRKVIKKIIRFIAGIFNSKIEFYLLYVSFLCIASLKDIVKNIGKAKFIIYTICVWSGYISSYAIFAEAVQRYGYNYSTSDVFTRLFSGVSLYNMEKRLILFWAAYLLLPLFGCWLISIVRHKNAIMIDNNFIPVLPYMNQADRLSFLKTYYEEENKDYIQTYLNINKDVTVLEDNSAGSNASTLLVMTSDGNIYYRKYAFGKDGEKLQEQINWIEKHQTDIPLPIIVNKKNDGNCVTYDMHSYRSIIGLFRYIHTMPIEISWNILRKALDEINSGLHSKNLHCADQITIDKYIEEKALKNIRIIQEANKYIRTLEQNEYVIVNGQPLHTLRFYLEMLNHEHLQKIFSNDKYSSIHGDLTIENIICISDATEVDYKEYNYKVRPKTYYLIDPNTGNIHNSPFLDYAKILQSLHGKYEFLMMVTSVIIEKNRINFVVTPSEAYGMIYQRYRVYLYDMFTKDEVISIYYHEIIHWLRLMPYKIKKNEKLAVVFYTGLLTALNDVWEIEHAKEK